MKDIKDITRGRPRAYESRERLVPVGVALAREERERLHEIAAAEGRSLSAQLRYWIRGHLAQRESGERGAP